MHLFCEDRYYYQSYYDEATKTQGGSVTHFKFTARSFLLSLPLSIKKIKAINGNTYRGEVDVRKWKQLYKPNQDNKTPFCLMGPLTHLNSIYELCVSRRATAGPSFWAEFIFTVPELKDLNWSGVGGGGGGVRLEKSWRITMVNCTISKNLVSTAWQTGDFSYHLGCYTFRAPYWWLFKTTYFDIISDLQLQE